MANVTIRFEDRTLRRRLRDIVARVRDMRPAFRGVGELLADSARETIDAGGRPAAWPARKRTRGRTRRSGGKLLVDSGRLYRSIRAALLGRRGVDVGSRLPYAAAHQFGKRSIPARPFLIVQPADEPEMGGIVERFIVGDL